jgi:hypothetical protein
MTPYSGPATVTTTDGAAIPVTANLSSYRIPGRTGWHGTLAAAGRALLNVQEGQVRLPDGRESGFVRIGGAMGPGAPIQVEGSSGDTFLGAH